MGSKAPCPRSARGGNSHPPHPAVFRRTFKGEAFLRLTESRDCMKALWSFVLLLALALAGPAAAASPAAPAAPQAATVTATYTLYGNATSGWGLTPTSTSNPGPTITASVGENVTLRLFAADAPTTHNWFLALDGGSGPTAGEPSSPDFSSSTTPVVYSFTVPNQVGTFTYKCRIHPTLMTGSFVIVAAPTFVLYGSATSGWGFGSSNTTTPGPTLTVAQGQTVSLALYSADGQTHAFFVSYDGATTPSSGEPVSADFNSTLVPTFLTFTASQAGNFTYYCKYHSGTMKGPFTVTSSSSPSSPPSYTLYAAVIVVIVVIAIIAAIVIRRKPKTPPAQPPMSPPSPPQG